MNKFDFFINEIILNRLHSGLSWRIYIPNCPDFRELTERFHKCLVSFEEDLMNRDAKDRSLIAGITLDDLITAMINADICRNEDKDAPQSVTYLCMVLHNGIKEILTRLSKLNIIIPDYIIKRLKRLMTTEFYVGKRVDGTVIEEGVDFHYSFIFGSYIGTLEGRSINNISLPDELNTDMAKKIFSKAVKAGLMQSSSNGNDYQWNGSNAMLAYLCGRIYCGDRLKQDAVSKEWMLKRGKTFFPETALMSFFVKEGRREIKNLGQSRLQMQRPPKGYEDIDRLFDEAT